MTIDFASIADRTLAVAIVLDDVAAEASWRAFARRITARRSPWALALRQT
jgi:hypothetical protein